MPILASKCLFFCTTKGVVTNYGEGGYKTGGGGKGSFLPLQKGGSKNRFTHAEGGGGHSKF